MEEEIPLPEAAGDATGSPAGAPAKPASRYTALVYFHGIGQQRRWEEISRLVERLDQLIFRRHRAGDPEFQMDHLRGIEARSELRLDGSSTPKGDGSTPLIPFIEARFRAQASRPFAAVRFFEAYWAPEAAVDQPSIREVLTWLGRQAFRPFQLLRSRWRGFERLRRSDLWDLYERKLQGRDADGRQRRNAVYLTARYREFHNPESRRDFPAGSFREFLHFLQPSASGETLELAKRWRRHHLASEAANAGSIFLLFLGVAATLALLGLLALRGLTWLHGAVANAPLRSEWVQELADRLQPSSQSVIALVAALLTVVGVGRFLTTYVGDVLQFATYEEVDQRFRRRRAVLDQGCGVLRHVLADPRCDRVVVVGHSLGSAVALDVLLELRHFNRASLPDNYLEAPVRLDKIRHFVTMGSPIDKIHYFFAAIQSRYHRYERIVDNLRGDIGSVPFCKVGLQPHVHWINFWDRGDLISGRIDTVVPDRVRKQRVDNVQIASFRVPDPMASHSAYFEDERVMTALYRIVFLGHHAFAAGTGAPSPFAPGGRAPWMGPGQGSAMQTILHRLLLPALPVTLVLALLEVLSGTPGQRSSLWRWTLVALTAFLLGGIALHLLRPQRPRSAAAGAAPAATSGPLPPPAGAPPRPPQPAPEPPSGPG